MKNNYCTLYIARHGETQWNVEHRFQGQKDSPLTENGLRQATELGSKLKNVSFDAVFSSDLFRAMRTAEIAAIEHKLAVNTTALLREHSYGKVEGKLIEEARRELHVAFDEYERLSDEEKFRYKLVPEGESDEQIVARLITFIREASVSYPGKNILVVTHGGLMSAFLVHLGVGTQDNLRIANTGYFILKSDGVDFFIQEMHGVGARKGLI
ncbi:MAG: histidine phosphatase family protein [bacterium]|nr:histidine phosphatase family protein [bacterium]